MNIFAPPFDPNAAELQILQFGSDSCGPCHAIREKLDHWNRLHPNVRCTYVPTETQKQFCAQHSIFSVPTLLLYTQGHLTLQESGYFSLESFLERVERYESLLK